MKPWSLKHWDWVRPASVPSTMMRRTVTSTLYRARDRYPSRISLRTFVTLPQEERALSVAQAILAWVARAKDRSAWDLHGHHDSGLPPRAELKVERLIAFRRSVDEVDNWLQVDGCLASRSFTPHTAGDDGFTLSVWRAYAASLLMPSLLP